MCQYLIPINSLISDITEAQAADTRGVTVLHVLDRGPNAPTEV
jgi:hypothetical protein